MSDKSDPARFPVTEALPVNSVSDPHTNADLRIGPRSRLRNAPLTPMFVFQAWKRALLWQHTSTHWRGPEGRRGRVRGGGGLPERLQRNQVDGVTAGIPTTEARRRSPPRITTKIYITPVSNVVFFFSEHLLLSHSLIVELFWWLF